MNHRSNAVRMINAAPDPAPQHPADTSAAARFGIAPIPDFDPPKRNESDPHDSIVSHTQLVLDLRSAPTAIDGPDATVINLPPSRHREPPPDPAAWARSIIQATLEALHGIRAPGQLRRWYAPRVHAALAARAACVTRVLATPPTIVVRSVRTAVVGAGRIEASGVVEVSGRCRAVALRMQTYDGRWRVTALEIG